MYLRILMLFSGVLLGAGHNTLVSDFLLLAVLHSARARKTEAHFTAAEMSSQRNQSDSFRFKHAAFYQSLKSKVGVAAVKAAALRINLNVEGCGVVAVLLHAPFRAPLLLHILLSHNLSPFLGWRIHCGVEVTESSTNKQHTHPPPPAFTSA